MKRTLFSFCFLLCCFWAGAQNPLFLQIRDIIWSQHPELSTDNKLIAFSTWSLEDSESRDVNKSFDEVYDIYYGAKLKGGRKGIIVVSIHLDGSTPTAATTMYHDGVKKLILIDGRQLKEALTGAPKNMVFDAQGAEVYRNLGAGEVKAAINQLITR